MHYAKKNPENQSYIAEQSLGTYVESKAGRQLSDEPCSEGSHSSYKPDLLVNNMTKKFMGSERKWLAGTNI